MTAFFGQVTIDSTNSGIAVDATPGDIAEGTYYVYSPATADCLLDALVAEMTDLHGAAVSYSISAAGVLTLSATATFTIGDWDTYELFGFNSGTKSGSNSYTADKSLQRVWIPGRDPSDTMAPISRQGADTALVGQTRAADGTTILTSRWSVLTDQELVFPWVTKAKAWNGSDDNSSWEEFWTSTYSQGRQLLYIPDWPDSEATYWEYKPVLAEREQNRPRPSNPPVDNFWTVKLRLAGV